MNFERRQGKLNEIIRGWINYFRIGRMKSKMKKISEKLRTRLRMICWKMRKFPSKREGSLRKMGIGKDLAREEYTIFCSWWWNENCL